MRIGTLKNLTSVPFFTLLLLVITIHNEFDTVRSRMICLRMVATRIFASMNNLINNLLFMKRILVPVLFLATIFTACKRDNDNARNNIYKGPETQLHGGKAWTWIQLDNDGKPERLAVTSYNKEKV
jgi:hypothetical protein